MDMNMSYRMQQLQKLVLTNDMRVSLQLLQMPINELQECIEKELNENPLLEIDYEITEDAEDVEHTNMPIEDNLQEYERLLQPRNNDIDRSEIPYHNSEDDTDYNPLNYRSQTISLKDYLYEQLRDRNEPSKIRFICEYLIELIDEDGFITDDLQEVAKELSKPYELVENAHKIIKELQPWGIGAKDFRESLLIQLKKKDCYDRMIEEMIRMHLELLADNKLKELAKVLGVTVDTVNQYVRILKSLEPKPGRGFYTGEKIGYIVPEAFLKKIGKEYHIIMNDTMLPKLNVNSYYQRIMKADENKEAVSFMKDKVSSALALMKGIEQRRKTIYRIIEKVCEYQKEYLDKGEAYLKPMNLKDLASELDLHESTISRAIKDKYIIVPRGTIRLRDLFTNGINPNTGDEDISTNVIKRQIEKLIKNENKQAPLSDQAISELLQKKKMNISRRTVAKYREELGIRPSGKRKVF